MKNIMGIPHLQVLITNNQLTGHFIVQHETLDSTDDASKHGPQIMYNHIVYMSCV
jgi:hypothetical protein